MRYTIDKMTMADIPRVVEIERLSYSSPWPPSAYRKEIQENPLAYYIVARDAQLVVPAPANTPAEVSRRAPRSRSTPRSPPLSVSPASG